MRRILTMTAAVALGLAPVLAYAAPAEAPASQGSAAPIPDATIGKAGAALHDVAQVETEYRDKMGSASPQQKQSLNEQANAKAVQAIQSHGLSVQEYSNVIRTAQNDTQVKKRLLDAAKSQP